MYYCLLCTYNNSSLYLDIQHLEFNTYNYDNSNFYFLIVILLVLFHNIVNNNNNINNSNNNNSSNNKDNFYNSGDLNSSFSMTSTAPFEKERKTKKIKEIFSDETWYKDSQFNPIDVVFSQKQLDDIEFMELNILPNKYDKQGSKESLPRDILLGAKGSLRDRVVQHLQESQKESSQQNENATPWFASYLDFNLDDIKIHLSIFLFAGLHKVTNMYSFWEKPDDSYGAFSVYNPTVANLISFKHQPCNYDLIYQYVNELLKKHYLPSYEFSFDDDLYGWNGIGGSKKRVPGKADKYLKKEAQSKSKLEPKSTQTQATQINDEQSKSVGNHILKSALNKLEEQSHGNIPKPIFEEREEQMKKDSRVKNKSTGTFTNQPITTPRFIHLYNHNHNFVDATKMVINPQRNIQRSPNYPRVILNDILYILLNNCMVVINMFLSKQKESLFSFRELLFHLCNNQLSNISNNNKRLGSKNKIIIPELIHIIVDGKPQRGLCYMCTNGFKVEGVTYSAHPFLRTQCHCCKGFPQC
ncbi:hypothetical protein ACTFIV_009461 [Dictyostelium citrinum]